MIVFVAAAAQLGLAASDYSCTGTVTVSPGPQLYTQVDRALSDGALNPGTARVIITTGFNDTYNNEGRPDADVRRDFVNYMIPQVSRIRAAAPNARIQFVGYPKITSGDTRLPQQPITRMSGSCEEPSSA